jgi:Domain of unknown function (DUF4352)
VTRSFIPLLLLLLLATAACTGGSDAAGEPPASGTQSVPEADQLPAEGTVRYSGRIYTVAAPGTTLELDDVALRIDSFGWQKNISVPVEPPGTRTFAIFNVTVTNRGEEDATVLPTQIWLLDTGNRPFIAAANAEVNDLLIGKVIAPGESVTGTLVYPLPRKLDGGLLVYRLADATGIAKAPHVGLLRY